MTYVRDKVEFDNLKSNKVLSSAAKLFLTKGYTETTVREIAAEAGMNVSSMIYAFKSKEDILCELVKIVIKSQFETAAEYVEGKIDDKIYLYAFETTLQLAIAENNEYIRDLYTVAYALPKTTEIIYHIVTEKLVDIFAEHLPNLEVKDFYEFEIASGGIMRSFMNVPCDMYFTPERKVKRFLECVLLMYRVSDEKIEAIKEFIGTYDFAKIAQDTIDAMLSSLED